MPYQVSFGVTIGWINLTGGTINSIILGLLRIQALTTHFQTMTRAPFTCIRNADVKAYMPSHLLKVKSGKHYSVLIYML